MTGVGIRHNGSQVVDGGRQVGPFAGRGRQSREPLLSVMEELSGKELGDFVGNGVGGVVGQIGSWFIGGGGGRTGLPSGDVDGFEVFGHLGQLDSVEGTVGDAASSTLASSFAFEKRPHLLGLYVGGVGDGQGSSLVDDIFGGVGSGDSCESRVL